MADDYARHSKKKRKTGAVKRNNNKPPTPTLFFFFFLAAFADGTKAQSERYETLTSKQARLKGSSASARDDDESSAATSSASTPSQVLASTSAVLDTVGLAGDDRHMARRHVVRDVAEWRPMPFDQMAKPKHHTNLRFNDPTLPGASGELWLLRVPADLDLALLHGASFDAALVGQPQFELALDAAAAAKDVLVPEPDAAAANAADAAAAAAARPAPPFVLSQRAPEAAAAFKCAFPTKASQVVSADDETDESVLQDVHYLAFGASFSRAFSLHRRSAPLMHTTVLQPTADDELLQVRHRLPAVPLEQLQHRFAPIGASAPQLVAAAKAAAPVAESHKRDKSSSSSGKTKSKDKSAKDKSKHKASKKEKQKK